MYAKRTPSMGTPSVYSHVTRSTSNLKSTRSMRSLKVPWYRRPILQDAYFIDIQRGSLIVGIYALILSVFTVITAAFDLYSLAMAAPGSKHYGFFFFSYEFVYVGNKHVRNFLVLFAIFSMMSAVSVFVTSIMLIVALRKEHEKKVVPWLYAFAGFTVLRILAWLFFAIVNDLVFGYNFMMVILWTLFCPLNVYGWVLVYSLYLELADLTKLEDLAHLRMGTMASLNASTTHSLANSRPTTPHSTISAHPVNS